MSPTRLLVLAVGVSIVSAAVLPDAAAATVSGPAVRSAAFAAAAPGAPPASSSPAEQPTDPAIDAAVKTALEGARSDAERAQRLYAAAEVATGGAKTALLAKAVDYALASAPAPAAVHAVTEKALDQLAALAPDRAAHWNDQKATLYAEWFEHAGGQEKVQVGRKFTDVLLAVGEQAERQKRWKDAADAYQKARAVSSALNLPARDEASQKALRAAAMVRVQQSVARWIDQVGKAPGDSTARTALLRALVIDLDDPAQAATYLSADVEEAWRTYTPLAAKPLAELKEDASKELGDWYFRDLLKIAASPYAKENVLTRAKACYERHLELRPETLAVKIALKQVEDELGKLGPRWIDLLRLIDLPRDTVRGTWQFRDGQLVSDPQAMSIVQIPYQPPEEYDFLAEFQYLGKIESVVLLPSKAGTNFEWAVGAFGNTVCGFEMIGGQTLTGNTPKVKLTLTRGTHTAMVQVRRNGVTGFVDGKPIVHHATDYRGMGVWPEWKLPDARLLGVGCHDGSVVFQNVRLREVTGRGKAIRRSNAGGENPG